MSSHCSTSRGSDEPPLRVFSICYIIIDYHPPPPFKALSATRPRRPRGCCLGRYNNNMFVKKKLRREDFLLESGWFEELVRKPGELHMQQFQISDCEECTVCLFDTAACVYID